jgi:type II secretory pathway pseudopilin PulG
MSREGNDHLIRLISMMGAKSEAGDGEAMNAFRLASRALESRGVTWRDVALLAFAGEQKHKKIWQDEPSRPKPREPEPTPAPSPSSPPPQETRKARKSSFSIPAAIGGIITIIENDRKAGIVILDVEGKDVVFGPIIAFRGATRDKILEADGKYASLRIRPPLKEGHAPQVVGCHFV